MQTEPNRQLEDGIHIRYGHHLFGRGEFDEGLGQMGMSSTSNPVTLLHLFPSLASPALLQPVSHLVQGTHSLHCMHLGNDEISWLPVFYITQRSEFNDI